ncbi:hypothetical protein BDY19DRAFT_870617, partial [Irpex rosettiformis]
YRLAGIIYFGDFHFTCRIIDNEGMIWYNDGIQTGSQSRYESHINNIHPHLLQCAPGHRKSSVVIYS